MQTRVGLALTGMMALAAGHIRAGRPEQMRSLVGAIPFADTSQFNPLTEPKFEKTG